MNILYLSDSTTVSGAEMVLLGYLDHFTPPEFSTHVFLHAANARLQNEVEARQRSWTATTAYSRILIETRANPAVVAHYARSFLRVRAEMTQVIRERKIDLVHTISYPASLYAAFAARHARIPQLWHEHNIKRVHRVNRHLYRFVARSCGAVVGPSRAVAENLARAGIDRRKLHTVYNGIDLKRFVVDDLEVARVRRELGLVAGALAVGLFGQLLPHKGHRTLVDAATRIRRAVPHVRFFFVGALENPPYEKELRGAIDAAGLSAAFQFCGWRRDVPAVLRAMDVLAVPTTTPEPAALGLMEAMAASRPVVASRTGGTPEIVQDGETGLLVPPGDAAALADAAIALLGDERRRSAYGQAGRLRVEQEFTLARHLEQIQGLYREAAPATLDHSRRASS